MSAAVEISLETPAGRFSALAWRNPGAPRALCLHGWLDNAASFIPLAPYLGSLDLVALDLAGHGHSAHRPAGARYHMMDNLWDVDAALDALEWPACNLVGHSLGGVIACTFAAASPERVERLVAIDGLGPLSASAGSTVKRLRKSLQSVRGATGRLREFDGIDAAVRARCAASDLSAESARLICERSLVRHGEHYRWRTDPALNWHSPVLMTEEQVLAILASIEAPALSITALPLARWIDAATARRRVAAIPNLESHTMEGHHHFHMERPESVAPLILEFLEPEENEHDRRQA